MTVDEPGLAGGSAPQWLAWTRTLQSIAQAGLAFARDPFDRERYEAVRRVAAEIAAGGSGGDTDAIVGLFDGARGYPTPKLDVRAAVIVGDAILLVRERDDYGWALPGGWADVGESAAQAVERETREEAGLDVRAIKLIALLDREEWGHPLHPEYSYKAIFACAAPGAGTPRSGPETCGAEFFARGRLPELSLARTVPAQIDLAFAHHAEPARATDFD